MNMNRFICEKVMGKCWHEIEDKGPYESTCSKCKLRFGAIHTSDWNPKLFNPNYSTTPADYFALLMFAIGSEWWQSFFDKSCAIPKWRSKETSNYVKWLLAPENFARLIALYFGWEEKGAVFTIEEMDEYDEVKP